MDTFNSNNKRKITPPEPPKSDMNKRLKRLVLPIRAKKLPEIQKLEAKLKEIGEIKVTKEEEFYQCTSCAEKLHPPYPRPLKRLIEAVLKNEQDYKKEQEQAHELIIQQCKNQGKMIPPFTFIKSGISKNDQSMICRMHKVELIMKPLARERGYPSIIEFEKIQDRIKGFKQELIDIINGECKSVFLDKVIKVFKDIGSVKARQANNLITRFDETLPGYYGNRGSHFIMETLNEVFLKSDLLTKVKSKPLTPIEFIQQVLVPECGIRLIKQDLNLTNFEKALVIMEESSEYGSIVYNKIKNTKR